MKKRTTTLPAVFIKKADEVRRLAAWYRDFKPEQKTITVPKDVYAELESREVPGFMVHNGELWYENYILKT